MALAYAVGPHGRVISYDRREDFLEAARANVRRAGLEARVSFRLRDVATDGLDATELSSVILDLPEPWAVLPSVRSSLVPGGYIATYTPTYNQLERTVRTLRDLGFDEVRAVELLERGLHVGEGGTRPAFEMLGHTGFLAAGQSGRLKMVVASLTLGAVVGVLLSGAFLYWEVGRYAEPQVPVTLFDERKELFAYTTACSSGSRSRSPSSCSRSRWGADR